MKKINFIVIAILLSMAQVQASSGYEKAMRQTIDDMYAASSPEQYLAVANKFDRIGGAEMDQWLPSYYSAFCYIMLATNTKDGLKMDGYLDKADEYLAVSDKRNGDRVEILAMRGFTAMMRITVDPATRGQEYSMKSVGFLQQAMQLDNQNPRVIMMLAQMQFGTAQFFGSDTKEACTMFTNALALFEAEEKESAGINPSWGKSQVESMLSKCEG